MNCSSVKKKEEKKRSFNPKRILNIERVRQQTGLLQLC